jgi:hypothetical protein
MITIKTVPPVLVVVLTILFILAATPPDVAVETSRLADFPTGHTNIGLTFNVARTPSATAVLYPFDESAIA